MSNMKKGISNEVTGEWEGTVSYVNQDKGFGFIAHIDYPDGLFFHAKDMEEGSSFEYLKKGMLVRFCNVFETSKGMSAANVEILA